MHKQRTVFARIPVRLDYPDEMESDVGLVLDGEYEAGYDGEGLTVVDLGANVGSFSIWASLRWPNSVVHAYEPNPATFEILTRNTRRFPNIICHQQAVYPGDSAQALLYQQYAGDGEAGLLDYIGDTFQDLDEDRIVPVETVSPGALPECDVLKLDVEGGEAAILEAMDVKSISLILLEYQNMKNRRAIEHRLEGDFERVFADSFSWDDLLPGSNFQPSLKGDAFGHLFFMNRRTTRLSGPGPIRPTWTPSARELLMALPAAIHRAIARRLKRARQRWSREGS
jgi:FkbM family methyltransferase